MRQLTPIAALRNLIKLSKSVHENQDKLTNCSQSQLLLVGISLRHQTPLVLMAKLKLVSQILHSYTLHHAFSNDLHVNTSALQHAKIIKGKDSSFYIVGLERINFLSSSTYELYYSLYELKPSVFTS